MKKQILLKSMMLLCMLMVGMGAWAQSTTLFHETFGNNTSSARAWSDTYSVKSGVAAVYASVTGYTVSNAKQGKNTTGQTQSGLIQTSSGTDAYVIIGPLDASNCSSMQLSYYWNAASTKGTYTTSASYATSSTGSYTSLTASDSNKGATSFVKKTYTVPAAAQVSTLYLKIVWNTSNTQAIIDEVDLNGVYTAPSSNAVETPEITGSKGATFTFSQNITITSEDGASIYYTTDGVTAPTTSSTLYTGPFTINATTTVKAIAVKDGKNDSSLAQETFTKTLATPTFAFATPATTINVGDNFTLDASSSDSDGKISYRSSNAGIVSTSAGVATGVAKGSAIITATLAATEDYASAQATCAITVVDPNAPEETTTFDFSNSETEWGIAPVSDNKTSTTDGHPWAKGPITLTTTSPEDAVEGTSTTFSVVWDTTPVQLRIYTGGSFTLTAETGYTISSVKLTGARVSSSYLEITGEGWGTYNSTEKSITWTGHESSLTVNAKGAARIETIEVTYEVPTTTINITTPEGYSTFYCEDAVELPEGVEGSTATVAGGELTLGWEYKAGDVVPAGTPILVKGTEGAHTATITTGGDPVGTNYLVANTTGSAELAALLCDDDEVVNKYYVLTYGTGANASKLGFYWYDENGGGYFDVPAGKVFLCVPAGVQAKAAFLFGGETDGINSIENVNVQNNAVYNLNGQRVNANQKGIVIVNGKKYLNK